MNFKNHPKELLFAYLALVSICLIWGTTYLGLRIGVSHFPPFLFSTVRFLIAGPMLVAITCVVANVHWPDKKTLINQAIGGALMITLGISTVGWAEVYISSGVAAIICSIMPIWTVLINLVVSKDDKPNWIIALGLITGLSGIVLIFGEHISEFSNANYKNGIILTFLANLSWAIGSVWIKNKNERINPFLSAGLQMTFGGIWLIPISLLFDDYSAVNWTTEVVYALGYMTLIGSVSAYACYSYAIKKLPMTIVSLYAYINPIVAVVLGWLVLNEKLNARVGVAIILTIVGIYLVNKGHQIRKAYREQNSPDVKVVKS